MITPTSHITPRTQSHSALPQKDKDAFGKFVPGLPKGASPAMTFYLSQRIVFRHLSEASCRRRRSNYMPIRFKIPSRDIMVEGYGGYSKQYSNIKAICIFNKFKSQDIKITNDSFI